MAQIRSPGEYIERCHNSWCQPGYDCYLLKKDHYRCVLPNYKKETEPPKHYENYIGETVSDKEEK